MTQTKPEAGPVNCLDKLPPELRRTLEFVLSGMTNKGVARALGVSARTVERRRAAALRVLGIRTPIEIARLTASPSTQEGAAGAAGFAAAFTRSAPPIGMVDYDGWVVAGNESLCNLISLPEPELVRHRVEALVHPEDAPGYLAAIRRILQGEADALRTAIRVTPPRGGCVKIEVVLSAVWGDDGRPRFGLGQVIAAAR